MHIVYEYKNNLFTSLFCHTFDKRDKYKLQRKNCGSYFFNITKFVFCVKKMSRIKSFLYFLSLMNRCIK